MSFRPEIYEDELYYRIVDTVAAVKPRTIIEIGSANGLGSTRAFVEGVRKSGSDCCMYCYEIDPERYEELSANARRYEQETPGLTVVCVKQPFVSESMSEGEVESFLFAHPNMNPAQYGPAVVLSWKAEIDGKIPVALPLTAYRYFSPLVALVDGSPFSGLPETKKLVEEGADVIILDDIVDIKNYDSYRFLEQRYKLVSKNDTLRNGYAIFERV